MQAFRCTNKTDNTYTYNNKSHSDFNIKINTNKNEINNKINNNETRKHEISLPISIPKTRSYNKDLVEETNTEEYSLNCSMFNPGKMSPPDPWRSRLQHRLSKGDIPF